MVTTTTVSKTVQIALKQSAQPCSKSCLESYRVFLENEKPTIVFQVSVVVSVSRLYMYAVLGRRSDQIPVLVCTGQQSVMTPEGSIVVRCSYTAALVHVSAYALCVSACLSTMISRI